jgi:TctA family transporter
MWCYYLRDRQRCVGHGSGGKSVCLCVASVFNAANRAEFVMAVQASSLTKLQCSMMPSTYFFLVTRGSVTLLAGHTHQPDESDCGGLQQCCH